MTRRKEDFNAEIAENAEKRIEEKEGVVVSKRKVNNAKR